MHYFKHILFVTHGIEHDLSAAKQALHAAKDYQAKLSVLVLCPLLPELLDAYKDSYKASVIEDTMQRMENCQKSLDLSLPIEKYDLVFSTGGKIVSQIVQQILHDGNDLLIKAPEQKANNQGFKSLDMELIRKCPTPIWLHRPMHHSLKNASVAVAIDPDIQENGAQELAVKLLRSADAFATTSDHKLSIISCWDFPLENTLRHSPFISVSKEHVESMVHDQEVSERKAVDTLIAKAQLTTQFHLHYKRGVPDEMIPNAITQHKIDILVMGTIGRTGLPGYFLGNTAENVLQKVSCSLIAIKPDGFVSPIKLNAPPAKAD